jgi:iron complex transport system substrate-binding protein
MNLLLRSYVLATAILSTVSCSFGSDAAAAPERIVDAVGRTVSVDTPARRAVVMFNYEEFTAIAGKEGWDRVVGYSKTPWAGWRQSIWERYAEAIPRIKALPDVGFNDDNSFSAETVISLRPDVVIMPEWGFSALGTAVEQLAGLGIPTVVIDYNAQTLERHMTSTRAIGAVMGNRERAEELAASYAREVTDVQRRVAATTRAKPKVYLELGQAGPETIGNTYTTTMWGKLFELVGADNIAKGRIPGALGQMNPEMVIASNPDFIFIAGSSWPNAPRSVRLGYNVDEATTRAGLAPYASRSGWENIAAVRHGHVYALQHGLARTLFDYTAMQYIAKQLYPEQLIANLRAYHERYLPVAFDGVWMLRLQP